MCKDQHRPWNIASIVLLILGLLFATISFGVPWGDCTGGWTYEVAGRTVENPTVNFYLIDVSTEGHHYSYSQWMEFDDGACALSFFENGSQVTQECTNCYTPGAAAIAVSAIALVGIAVAVYLWFRSGSISNDTDRRNALIGAGITVFAALFFTVSTMEFKQACLNQYPSQICNRHGPGFALLLTAAVTVILSAMCRVTAIFQYPEPDQVVSSLTFEKSKASSKSGGAQSVASSNGVAVGGDYITRSTAHSTSNGTL